MQCIKGGILAGIVLFLWYLFSWMVLPWHSTTLNMFKDEQAVADVIVANVPQSGIYILPLSQMQGGQATQATQTANQTDQTTATTNQTQTASMPMVFASVYTPGMPSMIGSMSIALVVQIIAAILVGWMLLQTSGLNYFMRLGFVLVFALTAGIITEGSYWNWFAFDSMYTGVMIADLLIGWLFAGLILAKICVKK